MYPAVYGTLPIVVTIKNIPDQFVQRSSTVIALIVSGKKMNVALDTTINHSSVVKRDNGIVIKEDPSPYMPFFDSKKCTLSAKNTIKWNV